MLDLHCHLLPGVDDGARDLAAALDMARALVAVGFSAVAASPHAGDGPGGDVAPDLASERRGALAAALRDAGIELALLPNAEHMMGPRLHERLARREVVPVGGRGGRWLFVELPWGGVPELERQVFALQAKGYYLLLAHPERYDYLDETVLAALVGRGVRLQVELGSVAGHFGPRARALAGRLVDAGLVHVLATDLHRPDDAEATLREALAAMRSRLGEPSLTRALLENPEAIVAGAPPDGVAAVTEHA
jgi:protein-tyrosine phosphatase